MVIVYGCSERGWNSFFSWIVIIVYAAAVENLVLRLLLSFRQGSVVESGKEYIYIRGISLMA